MINWRSELKGAIKDMIPQITIAINKPPVIAGLNASNILINGVFKIRDASQKLNITPRKDTAA